MTTAMNPRRTNDVTRSRPATRPVMRRVLCAAMLAAVVSGPASGQALGVLHVKVTVRDAARALVPVARHALLISDNPNTTTPRRVVTAPDGTVEVRLPPGN